MLAVSRVRAADYGATERLGRVAEDLDERLAELDAELGDLKAAYDRGVQEYRGTLARLEAAYNAYVDAVNAAPEDGDVYEVSLTSDDGRKLLG